MPIPTYASLIYGSVENTFLCTTFTSGGCTIKVELLACNGIPTPLKDLTFYMKRTVKGRDLWCMYTYVHISSAFNAFYNIVMHDQWRSLLI